MSQKKTVKKTKKVVQRSMEDIIKELSKAREVVARLEKEVDPKVEPTMVQVVNETVKSFKIPWAYLKQLQAQREIANGDREPDDVESNDSFQLVVESDGSWVLQCQFDEILQGKV